MKGLVKALIWMGIIGGIVFLVGWVFLFESHTAEDNSMAPNIIRGDHYLVYIRTRFQRGSPALCEHPQEPGVKVAGRILGEPGDQVKIERGQVFVRRRPLKLTAEGQFVLEDNAGDGAPLTTQLQMGTETTGMVRYMVVWPQQGSIRNMRATTVQPGDYFLIADNRATGLDSRHYGPVRQTSCIGRPFMIYRPGESAGDAHSITRWFNIVR